VDSLFNSVSFTTLIVYCQQGTVGGDIHTAVYLAKTTGGEARFCQKRGYARVPGRRKEGEPSAIIG